MFKKTHLLGVILFGLFSSNSLPTITLADTFTSDTQTKGNKAMTKETTTQMTPPVTSEQTNVLSLIEKMTFQLRSG